MAESMKSEYIPYTGGAGPTREQAEANTRALAEAAGCPVEIHSLYGDPELFAVSGDKLVIYDRWGFCSEGGGDLDQEGWEGALAYLKS